MIHLMIHYCSVLKQRTYINTTYLPLLCLYIYIYIYIYITYIYNRVVVIINL